jgi:hypothetical protein
MASVGSGYHHGQLISKGAEDFFLTEGTNKQDFINFFSRLHSKYIDFASTYDERPFNGNATWGATNAVCMITSELDFIQGLYIRFQIGASSCSGEGFYCWAPNLAYSMIEHVEYKASTTQLDIQTNHWLNVYKSNFVPHDKQYALNELIGHWNPRYEQADIISTVAGTLSTIPGDVVQRFYGPQRPANAFAAMDLYAPLPFACIYDSGWAFPYIASSRTELQIRTQIRTLNQVTINVDATYDYVSNVVPWVGSPPTLETSVFVRGCSIDPDVRAMYADATIRMLHLNVQEQHFATNSTTVNTQPSFRGPIAVMFVLCQEDYSLNGAVGTRNYSNQWNEYIQKNPVPGGSLQSPITRVTFNTGSSSAPRYVLNRQMFNFMMNFESSPRCPPVHGYNAIWFCTEWDPTQPRGTFNWTRFRNSTVALNIPTVGPVNTAMIHIGVMGYTILKFVGGTVQNEYY